jgi:hypothetical protein
MSHFVMGGQKSTLRQLTTKIYSKLPITLVAIMNKETLDHQLKLGPPFSRTFHCVWLPSSNVEIRPPRVQKILAIMRRFSLHCRAHRNSVIIAVLTTRKINCPEIERSPLCTLRFATATFFSVLQKRKSEEKMSKNSGRHNRRDETAVRLSL